MITHDFMETYGGAERVTEEIAATFPRAPVHAILARPSVVRRMGLDGRVISILPPRERLLRHYRLATPLFPAAVAASRLPDADALVSSSYAFAMHFRAPAGVPHACYLHSPLRFAWSMTEHYRETWARGSVARRGFDALATAMRAADVRAARRVTKFLTQSPFVAEQIRRYYGRDAEVIGAPVDCERFRPSHEGSVDDYYLFCGRLIEPYKRAREAVEAFTELGGARLVVAGDGPARGLLERIAGPNVEFRGALADDDLIALMQRCRALVFPSRDDFGLLPVEVMACGRPVLAYAGGGARHTVLPGITGEFFDEQTAPAIATAVESFEPAAYDPAAIRSHALRWDTPAFRHRLAASVEALL